MAKSADPHGEGQGKHGGFECEGWRIPKRRAYVHGRDIDFLAFRRYLRAMTQGSYTKDATFDAPSQAARAKILAALLPIAAQEGFTRQALERAAAAAGVEAGLLDLAAPRGVADMLDAFSEWADAAMEAELVDVDLLSLRIRERVKAAVLARLDALEPHKEAARRAAHALAVPGRARMAGAHLWRTADRIWRLLGDRSTDGNFYSKRAILSAVIGATMARWLSDQEPGRPATEAFLDQRIENVMQFEKLKARAKPLAAMSSLAVSALGRLRYGAGGERT